MRISLLSLIFILVFQVGYSQVNHEKPSRILILLDGSSSMINKWSDSQTRFQAASQLIYRLIDSIYSVNQNVEFALRVYGHQHPVSESNCFDSKLEVMFSKDNLVQIGLRLASIHPIGISPIAYSLKEAAENDLADNRYNYAVILITDGGESCNGDICSVSKELLNKKILFKPYTIGLVDYTPLKVQYSCLGNYLSAIIEKDISSIIKTIMQDYLPMILTNSAIPKIVALKQIQTPGISKKNIALKQNHDTEKPVGITLPIHKISKIKVNDLAIKTKDTLTADGYVFFSNKEPVHGVYILKEEHKEFKFLRKIEITGDRKKQKFKLPIGQYKVVYSKQNGQFTTETSKEFQIKKDMVREINLN